MGNRFFYPTGVRPLLVDEAARRRRVESRFITALETAGFAEVIVPIIDYVEPYAELEGRMSARQSYRFVDREGDLVAVRSDFTPTVARALAPSINPGDLPLRVFYRGDVIRVEASRLGAKREMFQIGAEIVGDGSPAADAEVMLLASSILAEFGIEPLLVYNDMAIASRLAATAPDAEAVRAIETALAERRGSDLDAVRDRLDPTVYNLVRRLAAGEATVSDLATCEATAESAARLDEVQRRSNRAGFLLHLDDFEDAGAYYTGLRFRLYSNSNRTPIARGGRYDSLYERFGTPAAAVGFTFTIDDLD